MAFIFRDAAPRSAPPARKVARPTEEPTDAACGYSQVLGFSATAFAEIGYTVDEPTMRISLMSLQKRNCGTEKSYCSASAAGGSPHTSSCSAASGAASRAT